MLELIQKLKANHIYPYLENNQLFLKMERGQQNPALIEEIKANKLALINLLASNRQNHPPQALASTTTGPHYPLSHKEKGKYALFAIQPKSTLPRIDNEVRKLNILEYTEFDEIRVRSSIFLKVLREENLAGRNFCGNKI